MVKKLPAALKAHQFKKGGGRVGKVAAKSTTKAKAAPRKTGSMPPALKAYWAKKRGKK